MRRDPIETGSDPGETGSAPIETRSHPIETGSDPISAAKFPLFTDFSPFALGFLVSLPLLMAPTKRSVLRVAVVSLPDPPSVGAPDVPEGFVPLTKKQSGALQKLTDSQVASARAVGAEITASKSYVADLGKDAPPAKDFARQLNLAASWAEESDAAEAYAAYASAQKQLAEDAAAKTAKKFQKELEHAVGNHPALAKKYPESVEFVGTRKAAAARANATKAAIKKAKTPKT
jgi:hypothetical protein